eukprot:Rmarinus@m.1816
MASPSCFNQSRRSTGESVLDRKGGNALTFVLNEKSIKHGFEYTGQWTGTDGELPKDPLANRPRASPTSSAPAAAPTGPRIVLHRKNIVTSGDSSFVGLPQSLGYHSAATRIQKWWRSLIFRRIVRQAMMDRSLFSLQTSLQPALTLGASDSVFRLDYREFRHKKHVLGADIADILKDKFGGPKPTKEKAQLYPFFQPSVKLVESLEHSDSDSDPGADDNETDLLNPHALNMTFRRVIKRTLSIPNQATRKRVKGRRPLKPEFETWRGVATYQLDEECLELRSVQGTGKLFVDTYDCNGVLVAENILLFNSEKPQKRKRKKRGRAKSIGSRKSSITETSLSAMNSNDSWDSMSSRSSRTSRTSVSSSHASVKSSSRGGSRTASALWYFPGQHKYVFRVEEVLQKDKPRFGEVDPFLANLQLEFCRTWLFAAAELATPDETAFLKRVHRNRMLFDIPPGGRKPLTEEMLSRSRDMHALQTGLIPFHLFGGAKGDEKPVLTKYIDRLLEENDTSITHTLAATHLTNEAHKQYSRTRGT